MAPPAAAPGTFAAHPADSSQVRAHQPGENRPSMRSAAVTGDAPAEVHVHIGRIEVTAVPESTSPRIRPHGGPHSMSLAEYLARRDRGRP
jgi:hypothetical protein